MKTILYILFLSLTFQGTAQTPEQQKVIDDAMRKQDSLMNLPHIKEMMARVKAMEAQMEQDAKEMAPPATKPKNAVKQNTNIKAEDSFYWYNTIESNTFSTFENWTYGEAEIRAGFFDRKLRAFVYIPMGTISGDGKVNLKLPNADPSQLPFIPITENYSEGERIFSDALNYSNSNAQWISTRFMLEVHIGGQVLGTLKMGDHIKPVVNLNAPCCLQHAGDGYALSWVFLTDPVTVTGEKPSRNGGQIVHDLKFTRGWNLIKIEVDGAKFDDSANTDYWVHKKHQVLSNMPSGFKFYFTRI